jgi:flagellar basal-body rod protein FlgG
MIDSLYIGATGMAAQQMTVDTISNNLANVNTPTYKKSRVVFEDLLMHQARPGAVDANGQPVAATMTGLGTALASSGKIFTDGEIKKSDGALDFAIRGSGFIEVVLPDGSSGYTRSGTLQVNKDGVLTTADGNLLKVSIQVPPDAKAVTIDPTGKVTASVPNQTDPEEIGQLELVNFVNPNGLNPIGDNLYAATDRSGDPIQGKPGDDGFGTIAQGFLEQSNVSLVDELINLVVAQRAYQVNAKVIQASDEMLNISNNLRR